MPVLVDSSVLIDHLRGDPRAIMRLETEVDRGEALWSVSVIRTEVLAGSRPKERGPIAQLFAQLFWLDVTSELADAAGHLASAYLRSHRGIGTVDYLVAAATQHLDAELLTLNVRHFPMLKGLRPAY